MFSILANLEYDGNDSIKENSSNHLFTMGLLIEIDFGGG